MRWPWRRRAAATAAQPHGRHERADGVPAPAPAAVAPSAPEPAPATTPAPSTAPTAVVAPAFAVEAPKAPLVAPPTPPGPPTSPAGEVAVPIVEPIAPIVSLGFADGESVALADDDPRVGSFRAAAAAMLGETTATPRS